MADVVPGHTPQNDPAVIPESGAGSPPQPADGDDAAVAAEVAVFLRQRFPHRHFAIILAPSQIIIQTVPTPATTVDTHRPLAPSENPSRHAVTAVPTAPRALPDDCATCITVFLQQHSVQRADGYTPVTTFLDAFHQWRTAAGQMVFSDEEMLATLMEHWIVYQGAHEGWILDEYTMTYP